MWSLGTFVIRQQPSSQKGAILAGYYAAAAFTLGLDNRRAVPVAATCRAIIRNACDGSDSAVVNRCCQRVAIDVLSSVGSLFLSDLFEERVCSSQGFVNSRRCSPRTLDFIIDLMQLRDEAWPCRARDHGACECCCSSRIAYQCVISQSGEQ